MDNVEKTSAADRRGHRKVLVGAVVSDKMQKTVVVKIERTKLHPKYKKYVKIWSRVKAHDEKGAAKMGDLVEVMETRPLSKDKRWRVTRVLKQAEV